MWLNGDFLVIVKLSELIITGVDLQLYLSSVMVHAACRMPVSSCMVVQQFHEAAADISSSVMDHAAYLMHAHAVACCFESTA